MLQQANSAFMIQYVTVETVIMEAAWPEILSPAFHLLCFVLTSEILHKNISLGNNVDNILGATHKTSTTVPSLSGPQNTRCAILMTKQLAAQIFWFVPCAGELDITLSEFEAVKKNLDAKDIPNTCSISIFRLVSLCQSIDLCQIFGNLAGVTTLSHLPDPLMLHMVVVVSSLISSCGFWPAMNFSNE